MAQINKPNEYFNTVTYTGNGTLATPITGVGFQPDLVWIKNRSAAEEQLWYDAVRGADKLLRSNNTAGDATTSTTVYFNSFDSDGFTIGTETAMNASGQNIVAWSWRGSDSSAVSNTAGSITSTVSANTTSGFSIVSYTGNATGGATVGHGLGVVPRMIIIKLRSGVSGVQWVVYHVSTGNTQALYLNTTGTPTATSGFFNNTTPSSTVFTLGTDTATNSSGNPLIAYCFADVQGFSKFGSYIGNGSTNGTFFYTGFKPSFVMSKRTDSAGNSWRMFDNKREGYNGSMGIIHANLSDAESIASTIDFLSNGFKIRATTTDQNASGATYIYMAFAEEPLVGDNPATAR